MKITNHHSETLEFVTGIKDGAVVMKGVAPGATETVDVKPDDMTVVARINAGLITVDAPAARKAAAAQAETQNS